MKTQATLILGALLIASSAAPMHAGDIKFKGDLRLRYQNEKLDTDDSQRNRFRYRLRLKGTGKVNESTKVTLGVASGGDDPRSTNQTFDSSFSSKGIRLDLAYVDHKPGGGWAIRAGKMKNPIWKASDMLWDSDVNPEGIAVEKELDSKAKTFTTVMTGYYVIEESDNKTEAQAAINDPSIIFIQPKIQWEKDEKTDITAALAYYSFSNLKNTAPHSTFSSGTNTVDGSGNYANDYTPLVFSGTWNIKDSKLPLLNQQVDMMKFFAEYLTNTAISDANNGYIVGVKFGNKKVKRKGQWQAMASYRNLEKDAWVDFLPDSDAISGKTGIKGWEFAYKRGIAKNLSMGVDYYATETIDTTPVKDNVLQLDLMMKF